MIRQNVPLVSVLICTYNAERFIEMTLLSILHQTYDHIEVLILDNCSHDCTVQKIKSFTDKDCRIKLFTGNENVGPYAGLNYLLEKSKGRYIAIQDHDDIWHPQKLELQVAFLENHYEYSGCGGLPIKFYEKTYGIQFIKVEAINNFSPHPSLVFRNKGYRYDTSVLYKTDAYFMKYIICDGKNKLYNIQKYLYISRVRADGNNLNNKWLSLNNLFTHFNKTSDYRILILGFVKYFIPINLLNFFVSHISIGNKIRKVDYLNNDDFTKEYLRYLKN